MSQFGGQLEVGEFVEYEQRAWRVGLVNFTRARLDPVKLISAHGTAPINRKTGAVDEYAGSVNVGPASTLRRLTFDEAASYNPNRKESERMGTEATAVTETGVVAGAPIPTKSARVNTSKERKAAKSATARKATGSTKTAAPKRAKATKERVAAVADKPCKCGCGGKTASHFIAGHDARFKGWLLKIERGQATKEDLLKKPVRDAYTWKRKGKGEIPTTDYRGNKHTGYESTSEA